MNVALKEGFTQVCVWQGTVLGDSSPKDFEDFIKEMGLNVSF